MKVKLFCLSLFFFFMKMGFSFGQENRISRVTLTYQDARALVKPNYNWIYIVISRTDFYNNKSFTMHINSNSMSLKEYAMQAACKQELEAARLLKMKDTIEIKNKLKMLEQLEQEKTVDKTISLTKEQYDSIVKAVFSIHASEVSNSFVANGIHGYYINIEFGTTQESIKYSMWSPGLIGKKRGNPNFSAACRLILETAGIKPRKVL